MHSDPWCSCLKKKEKKKKKRLNCICLYKCVIDQAWGQDCWIFAEFFFAFLWTETKSRLDERAEKKSGNEGPILPVRRANQSTGFRFILPAREYNHIIRIFYFNWSHEQWCFPMLANLIPKASLKKLGGVEISMRKSLGTRSKLSVLFPFNFFSFSSSTPR